MRSKWLALPENERKRRMAEMQDPAFPPGSRDGLLDERLKRGKARRRVRFALGGHNDGASSSGETQTCPRYKQEFLPEGDAEPQRRLSSKQLRIESSDEEEEEQPWLPEADFHLRIAKMVFANSMALDIAKDPAARACWPGRTFPSEDAIAGELLDRCSDKFQAEIVAEMRASKNVAVQVVTDGAVGGKQPVTAKFVLRSW